MVHRSVAEHYQMAVNETTMSQPSLLFETLRFFSSQIWHSKLDELKPLVARLPFNNRLLCGDASLTFSEALATFARLEKCYQGLQFLSSKSFFSRKEDFELSYKSLQMGFDGIAATPTEPDNCQVQIAVQLRNFCLVRACLIAFYHSIDDDPMNVITACAAFGDSLNRLRSLLSIEDDNVSHAFEPIRLVIGCELNILVQLLRAQSYIADLFFSDSLLCLKRASDDLSSLHDYLGFESPSHVSSTRSPGKAFALLTWLNGFRNTILAKYTLYWYNIIKRCLPNQTDLLAVTNTEDPNLVRIVLNFQKLTDALYISIFFDTTCQAFPFLGHGYVLRGTAGEAPTGVESIPPIFTAPLGQSIPAADVYAIVMQISGVLNLGEAEEYNKLVYLFDEKLNHTYFIQKLECRIFLILVYEGCKSRKDKQITSFISTFSNLIRLKTIISQLRLR